MDHYKIAIPEMGEEVNQHFGQSTSFAIIEIEDKEVINISKLSAAGLAHQHEGLASALKNQGVEKVIVGGIGSGAATALAQAGMEVMTGAQGNIRDVANTVAKGLFIPGASLCNHESCNTQPH